MARLPGDASSALQYERHGARHRAVILGRSDRIPVSPEVDGTGLRVRYSPGLWGDKFLVVLQAAPVR